MAGPYDYGAPAWYPGEAPNPLKPARAPLSRRRLNLYAIFLAVLLPWGFFCGIYALASFKIRYTQPTLFYALLAGGLAFALLFGVLTLHAAGTRRRLGGDAVEPNWLAFLFYAMLLALVVGLGAGCYNYNEHMHEYYDLAGWSDYTDVSPQQTRGTDVMDAGSIVFVEGSKLDLSLSTGYTSDDTYCVAPVTVGATPLAFYDFWAVGKNCCGSHGGTFRCDGYHDDDLRGPPRQYSGTRFTGDDLAFYRLAVERATAAHHVQTGNPVFLTYAKNPVDSRHDMAEDGYYNQVVWCIGYGVFQFVLVAIAVRCIGGPFFTESLF